MARRSRIALPTMLAAATGALSAQSLYQTHPVDYHVLAPMSPYVRGIAAGDVDGDGDDDLAVADGNDAVILRWQGGAFVREVLYNNVQFAHMQAAIADFDGDGSPDVLFGPHGTTSQPLLRIWWGDGTGSFSYASSTTIPIPGDFRGSQVAVDDVDHDGDVDLVLAKPPGALMHSSILIRSQGNRTFAGAPPAEFPQLFAGVCSIFFVDLDGDTFDDLLTVSRTDRTRLFWNNGGLFVEATPAQFPVINASLRGMAQVDVDGDLDLDLVLGGDAGPGVLLRLVGPRHFTVALSSPTPARTVALHAGDVDGDGDQDLYAFRREQGRLLENDGSGSFTAAEPFGSCDELELVTEVDLDGDGDRDVLQVGYNNTAPFGNHVRIRGSYTVRPGLLEHLGDSRLPIWSYGAGSSTADIDGDGQLDLVLDVTQPQGSSPPAPLQFATNDGRGVFTYRPAPRLGGTGYGFFADIQGDSGSEFVTSGATPSYFANVGGELAATSIPLPVTGTVLNGTAADIDGDGHNELLVTRLIALQAYLAVYVDTASGWQDETAQRIPTLAAHLAYSTGSSARVLAADIDGDGDLDLWLVSDAAGRILRNQGGGYFIEVPTALPGGPLGRYYASVGDLDGNGSLDLCGGRHVYFNDGAGGFTDGSANVPNVSGIETLGRCFDIDGDGDLDLIGQGLVAWNDGNGSFTLGTNVLPFNYFANTGVAACLDMDRDGDPDVVTRTQYTIDVLTNMTRQTWLQGPARLGGAVEFHFVARPGGTPEPSFVWTAASFARIPPVDLGAFGWLMIDPGQAVVLGGSALPASGGEVVYHEPVPNVPSLLATYLCAQSIDLRGGRLRLGNLVETWLGR